MMRVISLGAGVQSTTVALMAARGDIPPVIAAIFADTGDEPQAVYRHLDWLERQLPFPVYRVSAGHLSADLLAGQEMARIPAFVGDSIASRQCTRNYKIRPIRRKVRELLGVKRTRPGMVNQLIGISLDEAIRQKPSGVAYVVNAFPLIEMRMNRKDCVRWLQERQYPVPPKSSCIFCPYRSDAQHSEMRETMLDDWAKAIAFDAALRRPENIIRFHGSLYIHRSMQPLAVAALTADERGQPDLFANDCEGMCGV